MQQLLEATPAVDVEPVGERHRSRARIVIPLLVLALAAGVRLYGLSSPAQTYWDESYYAFDAYHYLGAGAAPGHPGDPALRIDGEVTWVHPPLGKWLIATGMGPLGFTALGSRLPSALFGVAGVLLLYLLCLELWGSVWWAGLAAALLALDGLSIVQSRIATLDVFLTTFVLGGIYLMVLDRTRGRHPRGRLDRWFGSRYLLGAGVLLGAAVATKWSGLFALAFGTVLAIVWSRRRGRRLRTLLLPLVAVPVLVYLASYASFFAEHGFAVRDFLSLQARMLDHQLHHTVRQPQNSSPLVWPVLGGAFTYFRRAGREIAPIGNPALWFGFLALLPFLFRSVRRDLGARLALGGYAALYLPWLVFSRTQFVSYMTPAVPFMCLGVAAALRGLNTPRRTAVGVAILGATALAAVWLLPVWLGLPAPHMWVSSIDRMFGL